MFFCTSKSTNISLISKKIIIENSVLAKMEKQGIYLPSYLKQLKIQTRDMKLGFLKYQISKDSDPGEANEVSSTTVPACSLYKFSKLRPKVSKSHWSLEVFLRQMIQNWSVGKPREVDFTAQGTTEKKKNLELCRGSLSCFS